MTTITNKLYDLLDTVPQQEALNALAEVLSEYGLEVAANLTREFHNPSYMTKQGYEEHHFGEGNEEAGYISLDTVLSEVEQVINCDKGEKEEFSYDKTFVRLQTPEELVESGNDKSDIIWYTNDEKDKVSDKLIGFSR